MKNRYLLGVCVLLLIKIPVHSFDEFVGPQASWVNLKTTFGAVGNGTTDDAAAIQRAFDSLTAASPVKTLYIPAGTYRITKPLEIPRHNASAPPTYGFFRIVGEDPTKVTILFDGPIDTFMVWVDGQCYSSFERITWDGNNKAGIIFKQMWSKLYGNADTYVLHIDEVFKNAKYGIRCPNSAGHQMDAEVYIFRSKFINLTGCGVMTASANNQNWFVWYSTFEDCQVGVMCDGYLETYVYNCNFYRSMDCDVKGITSARGCYSYQSKAFGRGYYHPINNVRSYYYNTIVCPVDAIAIDEDAWQVYLVDNVIRSNASVTTGPVVRHTGGHTIAVGNTFTVANPVQPFALTNNRFTNVDNSIVSRTSAVVTEPVWPGFRPQVTRKTYPVPSGSDDATSLQIAIDSAVAYATANAGSRPIVYLSRSLGIKRTVFVPANTDIQMMSDGFGPTLSWAGSEGSTLMRITGPTKFSMEYVRARSTTNDHLIEIINCDQPGSRFFTANTQFASGLFVNGTNNMSVVSHTWFSGGIKVVGGSSSTSTSTVELYGSPNHGLYWAPNYELVNGGRLLVQDAYCEMFLGPVPYVYAHGVGARAGEFSCEIVSNISNYPTNSVYYKFEDWPGHASFLMGASYERKSSMSATTSTIASQMNLMSLGCYFPVPTSYPAESHIGLINRGAGESSGSSNAGTAFTLNVTDTAQFIRESMAFRRSRKALPLPLAAVGTGASDIRMYRVFQEASSKSYDVYVQGTDADTTLKYVPPTDNFFVNGDFERGSFEGWQKNGASALDTLLAHKTHGVYGAKIKTAGSDIRQWGGAAAPDSTANWFMQVDVMVEAGTVGNMRMWRAWNGAWHSGTETEMGDSFTVTSSSFALGSAAPGNCTWTVTDLPNGFKRVRFDLGPCKNGAFSSLLILGVTSGTGYVYTDNWIMSNDKVGVPVRHTSAIINAPHPMIYSLRGMLVAKNIMPGAQVNIYNAAGRLVFASGKADNKGVITVKGLSCGYHVVNIRNGALGWTKGAMIVR